MTTATAQTYTWQDKKKGFSTRKTFVMQTSVDQFGRCRQTTISIFTHENSEDSAYIDYGSNAPFSCNVDYARHVAKRQIEAGYKFI